MNSTPLRDQLLGIGLRATAERLDDLVAHVTKKRLGPAEFLEHIAELEQKSRALKSMERRLARSRLGRFKPIVDYEWNWPTKIDRDAVETLLRLDFVSEANNVVLVANQGLGKTMIAKNLAHQAITAGHSVLFTTASQMLLDLAAQDSARGLDRRLRYYARVGLLVVDELGYLSYDSRNADLLFQVVSRRYEKKSLVLTTNLAFSDWPGIFPNAACATALIDRVVHHASIVKIEGESYRLRAATDQAQKKTKRAAA